MQYKKHRFNIYPEMQAEEFERLRSNIFTNGYDKRYPIILFEGEVIDGWNRYRACEALGIEPIIQHFTGSAIDAMQLVIRSNDRRDLNSSQRAAIAVEAEDLVAVLKAEAKARHLHGVKTGGEVAGNNRSKDISSPEKIPESNSREQNEVRTQLAQTFNTNPRYVSDAARLKEQNPEAFKQVLTGAKTISEVKKEEKFTALKQAQKEKELTEISEAKNLPVVYLSDCRQYLSAIEPESIDLIITDPPYLTEFDLSEFGKFIDSWLKPLLSKLNSGGRAYICTGAYPNEMLAYLTAFQDTGFIVDAPLVWTYRNTLGQTPKVRYNLNYQLIWHLYRPTSRELNTSITNEMFSVQDINAPDGRLGNRYHTWQKPDELAYRIIRHASNPGDTVLDIFACTGTFLLAAAKMERNAIGCEIDENNIEIAKQRGCKIG